MSWAIGNNRSESDALDDILSALPRGSAHHSLPVSTHTNSHTLLPPFLPGEQGGVPGAVHGLPGLPARRRHPRRPRHRLRPRRRLGAGADPLRRRAQHAGAECRWVGWGGAGGCVCSARTLAHQCLGCGCAHGITVDSTLGQSTHAHHKRPPACRNLLSTPRNHPAVRAQCPHVPCETHALAPLPDHPVVLRPPPTAHRPPW